MKSHNLLLSKGYFPKELPPTFTTDSFGRKIDRIVRDWSNAGLFQERDASHLEKPPGKEKRRKPFTYRLRATESEVFSIPKGRYERRNIHIVHPLPQALLSMEIGKNWNLIEEWLSRQTFSEDKIQIGPSFERSVKEINFSLHATKKRYLEATSDWIVTTDVNLFYPSIYTHSIAWAAYGKECVKSHSTKCKGSLADRIDKLVRSCNGNQTIGIPIGPETSRIVAEILSTRIEKDYYNHSDRTSVKNTTRLQDDWTIGVESLENAEHVLSTISRVYRTYGLDINGNKTSIDHIIAERPRAWISEIQTFLSYKSEKFLKKLPSTWLEEFLDLVLTLQLKNSSDRVVSYALSSLKKENIAPKNIPVMESFLIKSATIAPLSLDRICQAMLDLQSYTNALSNERISERFIRLAEVAIEKEHLFEVMWLLYTLRGLRQCINSKAICDASARVQSATIALILMDMNSKNLISSELPIDEWQSQISEDSILSDWTWLMAYEGIRHGWLSDEHNLMEKPLFKPLDRQKIMFYNPNKKFSASANARKKRVKKREVFEVKDFLEDIREIEIIDFDFPEY